MSPVQAVWNGRQHHHANQVASSVQVCREMSLTDVKSAHEPLNCYQISHTVPAAAVVVAVVVAAVEIQVGP